MGIYLPEIYEPCICSACCRTSVCTTKFIMYRTCKISSYLLPLAEVGHWAFSCMHLIKYWYSCICGDCGKEPPPGIIHCLHLCVFHWFLLSWASSGDPECTWSHESVTTSCYYCKQQREHCSCMRFSTGFVFLAQLRSQGIHRASESAISCLETKHAGYCRLAEQPARHTSTLET